MFSVKGLCDAVEEQSAAFKLSLVAFQNWAILSAPRYPQGRRWHLLDNEGSNPMCPECKVLVAYINAMHKPHGGRISASFIKYLNQNVFVESWCRSGQSLVKVARATETCSMT